MSIRIGILGYGNLGKGVESAIGQNPDLELTAVFTRLLPENELRKLPLLPLLSFPVLPAY